VLDSFIDITTVGVGILAAILDDFQMMIVAVDALQIVQIVIDGVDLFNRYRFGNGYGSAN